MKKFKQVLAFAAALLILLFGMIGNVVYLTFNDTLNQIVGLISSTIVFFPAFTYWYETTKTFLQVKDKDNEK